MRWELLDRYLTDSCDAEERDEVDRWLAESAGNRRVLEQIAEALEQTSPESLQTVRRRLEQGLGLERGFPGATADRRETAKERVREAPKKMGRRPSGSAKRSSGQGKTGGPDRAKKKSRKRSSKKSTKSAKKKPADRRTNDN